MPVKKVPAKKPKVDTKRTTVKLNPTDWPICWVRTIAGDEFIAPTKPMTDGMFLMDPCVITYLAGNLVLAPYGMMAATKSFFFPVECILHANEVNQEVRDLYGASIENSRDYCQTYFNELVRKSADVIKVATATGVNDQNVVNAGDMDQLLKLLDSSPKPSSDGRSRNQTIDDLIKLAEAAGKGKNRGG